MPILNWIGKDAVVNHDKVKPNSLFLIGPLTVCAKSFIPILVM